MKKKLLCVLVFVLLFVTCASAAELTIKPGTARIGDSQYWRNTSITSVAISSGVRGIGSFAFYECSNITSVTIPSTVTELGSSAFRGCSSLSNVTIPGSVNTIGAYAFYGCSLLTEVTIENGVSSIGNSAFGMCGSPSSISIPASVKSIGYSVFASGAKPTITCTKGSYADTWAKTYGYTRSYADAPTITAESSLTIYKGGTGKITPHVFPSGYTVTYASSDKNVAAVAANGTVTGVAAGHATVTIKAGSSEKKVDVQVVLPVSSYTLSVSSVRMAKGRTLDVDIEELLPMNAYPMLTASSSNNDVVRVSGNTISAVGAGEATVTFSSINGVKQSVKVHVVDTAYVAAVFSGTATTKIPIGLTVITADSVTGISLLSEADSPVQTWTSGYTDSYGVRTWRVNYTFNGAGNRKLSVRTSDGSRVKVNEQVNELVRTEIFDVQFGANPIAKTPTPLTVKTSVYAKYIQLYNGTTTLLKTWNSGYTDKDGIRTWNLSYSFVAPGQKGLSICASEDGTTYGEKKKVYPLVGENVVLVSAGGVPLEKVQSASFAGDAYQGVPASLTVTTEPTAKSIRLCSEGGSTVYSWDSGYADTDGKRVWRVSYCFANAGSRKLSVSASSDGRTYGEAFPVNVKVFSGNAVLRCGFPGTPAVNSAADIEVVTPVSAQSIRLNAENGASAKEWTSGYSDSGNIRTWHVQYSFISAGNRQLSFSASSDGVSYGTAKYVSVTVEPEIPVIKSAAFDGTATVGTAVNITLRTGKNAKCVAMYAENGSLVQKWTSGYTDSGSERIWLISYKFQSAGTRALTFKASADGSSFGSGYAVKEPVVAANVQPKINSVSFPAEVLANMPTKITVKTTTNTKYVAMYAENGGHVKTWTDGYSDDGSVRTWTVEYTFQGEGNRKLSFKGSGDNVAYSAAVSATTAVNPVYPDAYSVKFDRKYGEVGRNITITVTTSSNAKKLMLCCESGTVCASWNADGNSAVSGNIRTWTVKYAFQNHGERYIIFKATADGKTFGSVATGNIEVSR